MYEFFCGIKYQVFKSYLISKFYGIVEQENWLDQTKE